MAIVRTLLATDFQAEPQSGTKKYFGLFPAAQCGLYAELNLILKMLQDDDDDDEDDYDRSGAALLCAEIITGF